MAASPRSPAPPIASTHDPRSPWCRAVVWGIALWAALGGPLALAQESPSSCEPLLAAAETRYVRLEFAEAESLLRACLAQPDRSAGEALRAYRLLALVFLRQDDLPEARQAVVRLLGVSFAYEPDPVKDPPAYVALVASIKDQLRVAQELPPVPDSVRVAPLPPQTEAAEPDVQIVRTDPVRPEDEEVADARALAPERRGLTRWLLVGGGALVAGVAAVLLTSGGSSAPPGGAPLPPPPAFPR